MSATVCLQLGDTVTLHTLSPRNTIERGHASRKTALMEQLQYSYLTAVAAAAGCQVLNPSFDDGVDAQIVYKRTRSGRTPLKSYLEVQMKSTSSPPSPDSEEIAAKMKRERFDEFAEPPTEKALHKIVVIMCVPANQAHWVFAREKGITIHRAAYWANLSGETRSGRDYVTVNAPTTNMFDDVALCQIMHRILDGGQP